MLEEERGGWSRARRREEGGEDREGTGAGCAEPCGLQKGVWLILNMARSFGEPSVYMATSRLRYTRHDDKF